MKLLLGAALSLSLLAGFLTWPASVPAGTPLECLSSGWATQRIAAGTYTRGFDFRAPGAPYTYDARGVRVRIPMTDANVKNGFVLRDRLRNVCVAGVSVTGTQSKSLPWDEVGHGGDCIGYRPGTQAAVGRMIAEGVQLDNCGGDAFDVAKDFSSMGDGYSWHIRNSWIRGTRDDVIENDACHPGEISNVLIESSFVFISSRPGAGKYGKTGSTPPVIQVRDSLVEVSNGFFKWPGSQSGCTPSPVLNMSNTILKASGGTRAQLNFPAGTYRNVTVVWTGSGSYPGKLPASGVTVTKDASVWHNAVAAWKLKHSCGTANCTKLLP